MTEEDLERERERERFLKRADRWGGGKRKSKVRRLQIAAFLVECRVMEELQKIPPRDEVKIKRFRRLANQLKAEAEGAKRRGGKK